MKFVYAMVVSMFALSVFAQTDQDDRLANIDQDEDLTEIQTVNDILKMQQNISAQKLGNAHNRNVWSNRKFTNFAYNNVKMDSKDGVSMGPTMGDGRDLSYKSNWGVSITRGKNFRLHNPIGNVLSIYLDYVGFDLSVSHFKYEDGYQFNAEATFTTDPKRQGKECFFTPWSFEKYEANYGMRLGPSITIAPFANSGSGVSFLKINGYFHFGYNIDFCFIPKDSDEDHYVTGTYDSNNDGVAMRLNWSHGVYTAAGASLSWKHIGVGFETRSGENKYKPFDDTFGKDVDYLNYKFKNKASRIYLQYRF